MMSNVLTAIGIVVGVAGIAVWNEIKPVEPVVLDVRIEERIVLPDRVEVRLSWELVRDCRFASLSSVQGPPDGDPGYRSALKRDIASRGPRGAGRQIMAQDEYWVFYKPETPFQMPNFILEVWHQCEGESVRSPMLNMPMEEFFEQ